MDLDEMLAIIPLPERSAIELAIRFVDIDGDHHKKWVIDQMIRILAGDKYEKLIRAVCNGENGPDTYDWDTGTAP